MPLPAQLAVEGLTLDSRRVQAGDLFCALQGQHGHGASYLHQANSAGAVGALVEEGFVGELEVPGNFPVAVVPALRYQVSALAARFFDNPGDDMEVIGVTGTNGKTSFCNLLAQLLGHLGEPTGICGSIGFGLLDLLQPTRLTTPDAIEMQKILAHLKQQGCRYVCMEVSSHGLKQGRVEAVPFQQAVFTNFSHDHLDYHEDMEDYWQAKKRLFSWPGLATVFINADDDKARDLCAQASGVYTLRYGLVAQADVRLTSIECRKAGFTGLLEITAPVQAKIPVQINLLGRFNLLNVLAVCSVAMASGYDAGAVAEALPLLSAVPGRLQPVTNGRPLVVIDYAHNPGALNAALSTLREHGYQQVLCVFGCGGERDKQKRAPMGRIASTLADAVWLTNDNPRYESPEQILQDISDGCGGRADVRIVPDRGQAIAAAIEAAGVADSVLIAGKGHESNQIMGCREIPFNDFEVARTVLYERAH